MEEFEPGLKIIDPADWWEEPYGLKSPDSAYEYATLVAACPTCEKDGKIARGHHHCSLYPIPQGWEEVNAPGLVFGGGWVRIIRRPFAQAAPPELLGPIVPSFWYVGQPVEVLVHVEVSQEVEQIFLDPFGPPKLLAGEVSVEEVWKPGRIVETFDTSEATVKAVVDLGNFETVTVKGKLIASHLRPREARDGDF